MSESPYLTIAEAAARARVSRNTVKRWIKDGLPHIAFNCRLKRLLIAEFDDWVSAHRAETAGTFLSSTTGVAAAPPGQLVERFRMVRR